MKKIKIAFFTLVLSVMGVVGSVNAVSINTSSKSTFSAVSRPIQSLSSNENDSENSKNGKCILWSPRIQNFKQGDQVAILLPNGKYTGNTHSIKIIDHGTEIATLTLENGSDYGVITFITDVSSSEIAPLIASLGSSNFGTITAGGVIDIGSDLTSSAENTSSKGLAASTSDHAKSSSNQNNADKSTACCSKITSHSSTIKVNFSSLKSSESSQSLSLSKNNGKIVVINSGIILPASSSKRSSKLNTNKKVYSHLKKGSNILSSPNKNSVMIRKSSSVLKAPSQMNRLSKKVKVSQTIVKQKESAKHQNNKYSASSVHRVKLPIQGILPATRMDSYTWLYSLIGLVIMIASGGAFFSKKRK